MALAGRTLDRRERPLAPPEPFGEIAICFVATDRYSRIGGPMLQLVMVGHSGQLTVSLPPSRLDWDLTTRGRVLELDSDL